MGVVRMPLRWKASTKLDVVVTDEPRDMIERYYTL